MGPITYKDAGVNVEKGDAFVERIKHKVKSTYGRNVYAGVGGFASLYDVGNDKLLAAGTDGVGTKLKLAIDLDIHDTIGIDLVAMCVNDIICTGAKPSFFMDYLASSSLDVDRSEKIIDGIIEGCKQSDMALIGGETAEMPGLYHPGDYDLAGFAIGEVMKKDVLDGSRIKSGDTLIGVASSGFHSNGYSLLRKLIEGEDEIKKSLLTPTRIYKKMLCEMEPGLINGLSHITGGGIENIPRMNKKFKYQIDQMPNFRNAEIKKQIGDVFEYIAKKSRLSDDELYKTFNMGVGMVLATSKPQEVLKSLPYPAWIIGSIK